MYLSTPVCTCAFFCACVCCTEGCLTPNRCHYFPLSSSHPSMRAEVFLLFCLCYLVCVCGMGGGVDMCVRALVRGWVLHKMALKKFQTLSCAFWLTETYRKSHFPTETWQQRGYGASQVSQCQGKQLESLLQIQSAPISTMDSTLLAALWQQFWPRWTVICFLINQSL